MLQDMPTEYYVGLFSHPVQVVVQLKVHGRIGHLGQDGLDRRMIQIRAIYPRNPFGGGDQEATASESEIQQAFAGPSASRKEATSSGSSVSIRFDARMVPKPLLPSTTRSRRVSIRFDARMVPKRDREYA